MKKIHILFLTALLLSLSVHAQISSVDNVWTAYCKNITTGKTFQYSGNPNELHSFDKLLREKTEGFQVDDVVYVTISFAGTDVVVGDTMLYRRAKHFWQEHSYLLSDCETVTFGTRYNNTWINSRYNSKAIVTTEADEENPIQGRASYKLGLGKKFDPNAVAYLGRKVKDVEEAPYVTLTSDPDHTWFYLYLYGTGNTYSTFFLTVVESDPTDMSKWDTFNYYVSLDFVGWKQVAIPYSAMTINPKSNSNHRKEPSLITTVYYNLQNNNNLEPASVKIDYLMILHAGEQVTR